MDEKLAQGEHGLRRYQFAIVCRIHGVHVQPQEMFLDPALALSYIDGLSSTDCGEDTVMLAVDPGVAERQCAATPGQMRALLESNPSARQSGKPSTAVDAVRNLVAFGDLEEVTRAFIIRAAGDREEMFALLDAASVAHAEGAYEKTRSTLAKLHYLARNSETPVPIEHQEHADG